MGGWSCLCVMVFEYVLFVGLVGWISVLYCMRF